MTQPNIQIACSNMMPDGDGGWQPIPPVLTKEEAILYLRLDDASHPERSLRYYREHGLTGKRIGKELRFTQKALEDFLNGNPK